MLQPFSSAAAFCRFAWKQKQINTTEGRVIWKLFGTFRPKWGQTIKELLSFERSMCWANMGNMSILVILESWIMITRSFGGPIQNFQVLQVIKWISFGKWSRWPLLNATSFEQGKMVSKTKSYEWLLLIWLDIFLESFEWLLFNKTANDGALCAPLLLAPAPKGQCTYYV